MSAEQANALYRAINDLHGVLNDQCARIDRLLNTRCDVNKAAENSNSDALLEISQDLDTRLAELEDAVLELAGQTTSSKNRS